MLAVCAYYAGIMLHAFAAYYAHNYAGIIGSSLALNKFYFQMYRMQSNEILLI